MDGQKDYTVYFGLQLQEIEGLPHGSILIVPASNDWNDFGFKCYAIAAVKPLDETQLFETSAYVSLAKQEDKTFSAIGILPELATIGADPVNASELQFPSFFSMLPDMAAYREVVQRFGSDEGLNILLAIRDVVAPH